MMLDLIGKSITVTGKVQGVFYRASTLCKAQDLGLKGWVLNELNGDVVVKAFGESSAVAELIVWCSRGSEFSDVKSVNAIDIPYETLDDFSIRY